MLNFLLFRMKGVEVKNEGGRHELQPLERGHVFSDPHTPGSCSFRIDMCPINPAAFPLPPFSQGESGSK
jgi:hypothetical protein